MNRITEYFVFELIGKNFQLKKKKKKDIFNI